MAGVAYEAALQVVQAHLGESALAHCVRVAATARALAETYGVDSDSARLAGLLHDWDRERSGDELLEAAKACGVAVTETDEAMPYLLHARTGAVALREALPGLACEVVRAVERHTVGAPDMSELDMVVYLADMLEPARTYDGVATLREAVGVASLPKLFFMGYRQSLAHLVEAGRLIHPDTVAVWNRLVAGGRA